jgi:chromosome segregation ATPase
VSYDNLDKTTSKSFGRFYCTEYGIALLAESLDNTNQQLTKRIAQLEQSQMLFRSPSVFSYTVTPLAELKNEIDGLEAHIEDLCNDIEDLEGDVIDRDEENAELREEIGSLNEMLDNINTILNGAN